MKRHLAAVLAGVVLSAALPAARAADVQYEAPGPTGVGYVGVLYGLVDPAGGTWYAGEDMLGQTSTTWHAVADTGASGCLLGASTLDAYGGVIPIQSGVTFTDEGFGGTEDFDVTEPLTLMVAGQQEAYADSENHSLYTDYGTMTMAASRRPPPTDYPDVDVLGMSLLDGRVLRVDPRDFQFMRWTYLAAAGSIVDAAPAPGDPGVYHVPLTMVDYFGGVSQPVDVAPNPMLSVHVRKDASDAFATREALLDTGSPLNFVSETYATDLGIDLLTDPVDFTQEIGGIGAGSSIRNGYLVDAVALDLGAGREGDRFVIGGTSVFVIPDAEMPGGLDAIFGNGALVSWTDGLNAADTTLTNWYVDTRDADNAHLVLVVPEPATPALLAVGAVAVLRRRRAA